MAVAERPESRKSGTLRSHGTPARRIDKRGRATCQGYLVSAGAPVPGIASAAWKCLTNGGKTVEFAHERDPQRRLRKPSDLSPGLSICRKLECRRTQLVPSRCELTVAVPTKGFLP